MLSTVSIARYSCAASSRIDAFREIAGEALLDEVATLARDLKGLKVCHLNSTSFGGGVAELLFRLVPFARALGIGADWRLMTGSPEFFSITKALHNALQGGEADLTAGRKDLYLSVNRESARLLPEDYDVIVVHDPQPAALRVAAGPRRAKWIWRCHIDTSSPGASAASFLLPYIQEYDAAVFTMADFVLPGLTRPRLAIIPPAIDPLSTKNMALDDALCRDIVADAGFDLRRPLVLQVSRFDPWKDPMGVVAAYRLAREEVPGLQLALIGSMAGDDPEGWSLLAQVQEDTFADPDIQVLTNLAGVGNLEVNAFQRAADLVIQKSLKEGFGLVVSESFWKGKAMVCGRAGGIPMQYPPGYDRFLVGSAGECATRMVDLLTDPETRNSYGAAAREHVRRNFLMPRLMRDEMRLWRDLASANPPRGSHQA